MNATALRKEIESFLRENGNSPAADSLRSAARALGEPSPGEQAARDAGSGTRDGEAKPNTPGADMNNAQPPGKSDNPFGGVKKRETAKELARLRFKKAKQKA